MIESGIHYDVSAQDYHADPLPHPSLSASIAKILIDHSPRHAWHAHPRLNPNHEADDGSARLDLGSVCHRLALGAGRDIEAIPFDSYRTKEAQARRDEARQAGRIPVLQHDLDRANDMVDVLRRSIAAVEGAERALVVGQPEAVIAWDEGGVWCRSMVDWIDIEQRTLWDYKTVAGSVHPAAVGRRLFDMGYDLQACFYERGLHALQVIDQGELKFRFICQEIDPPYLVSIVELDQGAMIIGRKKVAHAIGLWRRCIESGNWPGYPAMIARVDMPPWVESSWLARELADEVIRDLGRDPFLNLSPWTPPRPAPELIGAV